MAIKGAADDRTKIPLSILNWILFLVIGVSLAATFKQWRKETDHDKTLRTLMNVGGGACLPVLLGLIGFHYLKRRSNRTWFDGLPEWHKYKIAPPALIDNGARLVPAKPVVLTRRNDRIVVQPHRLGLPESCVSCGAPTRRQFKPPMALDRESKTWRCCEACQKTDSQHWRRISNRTALICIMCCVGIGFLPLGMSPWATGFIVTLIGTPITVVISIVVPNVFGLPLSRRAINRSRGWVSLRAQGPAYQKLIEERYSDSRQFEADRYS